MIDPNDGIVKGKLRVSELIKHLNEYLEFYGDTDVMFTIDGQSDVKVQLEHFSNAVVIGLENSEYEDEDFDEYDN